jgi:hypothetical protein
MLIRTMLIAMLLCASVTATADFVTVSMAHEVALTDLRLPASTHGTLSFKPCDTCSFQTVRVTAATRYEVNNRDFDLAAFQEELERVPNREEETVTVLHHLESNTIEAVRVKF